MLYKRIYNGHEILFWPVSSVGNMWLASENYLFVDGKLISKSGGFVSNSCAMGVFRDRNNKILLEMKTKSSIGMLSHLDYELFINEVLVDSGTLSVSNTFKIPKDIEQTVKTIKKTSKIDEIHTPLKKVSQSIEQVIEKNRIIANSEIIPPVIKKRISIKFKQAKEKVKRASLISRPSLAENVPQDTKLPSTSDSMEENARVDSWLGTLSLLLTLITVLITILIYVCIYLEVYSIGFWFWSFIVLSLIFFLITYQLGGFSFISKEIKEYERYYNKSEKEKIIYDETQLESLKKEQKEGFLKFEKEEVLNSLNVLLNPIPFPLGKTFYGYFRFIGRDLWAITLKTAFFLSYPFAKSKIDSRKRKIDKRKNYLPDDILTSSKEELFRNLIAIAFAMTIFSLGFYLLPEIKLSNTNVYDLGFIFGCAFILFGIIGTFAKSTNIVFIIRRRNRTIKNENNNFKRAHVVIIIFPLIILFMLGAVFSSIKFRNYTLYKEGKAAIRGKKWNQSDQIFMKLAHDNFIQYANVGDIFYEQGKYKLAYKYYNLNPYISSYYNYVLSAFYSGDLDKAYKEAWFSIKARGDYSGNKKAVLIYILGRVSQQRNDMPSAIQHYNKSLELLTEGELKEEVKQRLAQISIASGLAEKKYKKAHELLGNKNYKEAYQAFEKVYLSTSDYTLRFKAHHAMGHCKRYTKDYSAAKEIFLEILSKLDLQKIDKEDLAVIYYSTIGRGFWEEGNYKKGIEYVRKAYEESPNSLSVQNQLSWYLITARDKSLRRPHEALEIAITTNKIDKWQTPYYIDTLAGCYASIRDFENAISYCQKAIELAQINRIGVKAFEKNLRSYKVNKVPWD